PHTHSTPTHFPYTTLFRSLDAKRIAGVVYLALEAAYPYAFDNGEGPPMKAFQEVPSPQFPRPSEFDLRSFSALQKWDAQVYGFQDRKSTRLNSSHVAISYA